MRARDTARQYRLTGEKTPGWVALGFALLGTLASVATAWLLANQPQLAETTATPAVTESDKADSGEMLPVHASTATHSPQPPEETKLANTGAAMLKPAVTEARDCPPLFIVSFAKRSARPLAPPDLEARVTQLRDWLIAHPQAKLLVEGHTDSSGDEQFNLQLRSRRAKAIAALFVEAGVPRQQLITRASGEEKSAAINLAESPRHRRVTLQVDGAENCPEPINENDKR